jgi:hypothetical protein
VSIGEILSCDRRMKTYLLLVRLLARQMIVTGGVELAKNDHPGVVKTVGLLITDVNNRQRVHLENQRAVSRRSRPVYYSQTTGHNSNYPQ